MISKKMQNGLNKQLNAELYAAYLYFAISAWFEGENLEGFAAWMKSQALEETSHAMRFYKHILERGGEVELFEVKKPEAKISTPLEAFQAAYEHEKKVTQMINDLVDLAEAEKDNAAIYGLLNWFVSEQIEEEDQTLKVVEKLKMIADSKQGIFMLDRELGARPLPASQTIVNPGSGED
ncbi:ferritin [candidate division WOR-3 bacterium]|uniref:Ferritin n=1 Tax=candidate division WOR-3 bacterium TaxID=2052148 RepID=A0A9D5K8U5_UNCW3|nr:ferritin [candidate division WOR-3 bacterium]MBD3364477.1 ferritin [candidate division WOR-3 bacterium]